MKKIGPEPWPSGLRRLTCKQEIACVIGCVLNLSKVGQSCHLHCEYYHVLQSAFESLNS